MSAGVSCCGPCSNNCQPSLLAAHPLNPCVHLDVHLSTGIILTSQAAPGKSLIDQLFGVKIRSQFQCAENAEVQTNEHCANCG